MFEGSLRLGVVAVILSACATRQTALAIKLAKGAPVEPVSSVAQSKEQDDCVGNVRAIDSVAVCNLLQRPGRFRVMNKTREPVSLLSRALVEVQGESGNWRTTLARACLVAERDSARANTACVTLGAGDELSPPPWGGFDCTNPFGPKLGFRLVRSVTTASDAAANPPQ